MLGLPRGQIFRFLNQKENPDSSQGCDCVRGLSKNAEERFQQNGRV
jgi:hypothetical protein